MVSWQRGKGISLRQTGPERGLALSANSNRSAARAIYRKQKPLNSAMDPYAKPKERRVGAQRPKITHLPEAAETRTRKERQAGKQALPAAPGANKKTARPHFQNQQQPPKQKAAVKFFYSSSPPRVLP